MASRQVVVVEESGQRRLKTLEWTSLRVLSGTDLAVSQHTPSVSEGAVQTALSRTRARLRAFGVR